MKRMLVVVDHCCFWEKNLLCLSNFEKVGKRVWCKSNQNNSGMTLNFFPIKLKTLNSVIGCLIDTYLLFFVHSRMQGCLGLR